MEALCINQSQALHRCLAPFIGYTRRWWTAKAEREEIFCLVVGRPQLSPRLMSSHLTWLVWFVGSWTGGEVGPHCLFGCFSVNNCVLCMYVAALLYCVSEETSRLQPAKGPRALFVSRRNGDWVLGGTERV